MSRRQTTFWDRRGVLPGLPPSTLLLYYPRGPAAGVLPRLPSSVVYERVRQQLRLQANQEPTGTSLRTTRIRLQYLARLPSRLNTTNDKNFSVRDPSGPEEDLFRYATMEQPRLARPEWCCDSQVYLCEECGL